MKRLLSLSALLALLLTLTACGTASAPSATEEPAATEAPAAETPAEEPAAKETITVGASSTPHAEILEQIKPILAEEGYDLEIVVFDTPQYFATWSIVILLLSCEIISSLLF